MTYCYFDVKFLFVQDTRKYDLKAIRARKTLKSLKIVTAISTLITLEEENNPEG